ncbi:uncharacterized protein VNE69_06202 [Vairimorpha necatrix]|uniref:Uncharacterized protein n=1 Tax=Vairimorpha necatrix TaxID=6039 RepID=A0AAX4JD03_9MICR
MFQYYFLTIYFKVSSQTEELQVNKDSKFFENQDKQTTSKPMDVKDTLSKKRKISTNTDFFSSMPEETQKYPLLFLILESNDDSNLRYIRSCKDEKIQSNETKKNYDKEEKQANISDDKSSLEILIEKIEDWQKEDNAIESDLINLTEYLNSKEIEIYYKNRRSIANIFYIFKNNLKENLDKIEEVLDSISIVRNQKKILSDQFLFLIISIEYIIGILPKRKQYNTSSYFLIFIFDKLYERLYILCNTYNLIGNFEILIYNLKTFSNYELKGDKLSAIYHVEKKLDLIYKNLENIRKCCDGIVSNLTILRKKYKKQFKIKKK